MTTAPLPAAPSLEQLRNRARELQRAHRTGDAGARTRVTAHAPHAATGTEPLKLSTAQLVVAREHGFASWPRLRGYVARVEANGPALQFAYHDDLDYYAGRADGLRASALDGTPGAVAAFERHGVEPTQDGARIVVARMHGFPSWPALRRHVAALRNGGGEPFARAYRALERHDHAALARDRGADPAHQNAHGWTPLHQTAYSDQARLAGMLLDAGAPGDIEARGAGGTPLVAALFWGNRATSELLAERAGLHPRNLRVAAGLGRLDLIEEMVAADGRLTAEATAHRGFYRPHSGFPEWRPADDPREALGEALSWAARNDRADALDLLVARGARIDADVYRGTALAWAAATGRTNAARRLLALGADPGRRGTFGGASHGDGITPLHLAAQGGHIDVISVLLAAGADRTITDGLYGGTPADWAGHCGRPAAAEMLR
jgi:hypothetical protein